MCAISWFHSVHYSFCVSTYIHVLQLFSLSVAFRATLHCVMLGLSLLVSGVLTVKCLYQVHVEGFLTLCVYGERGGSENVLNISEYCTHEYVLGGVGGGGGGGGELIEK